MRLLIPAILIFPCLLSAAPVDFVKEIQPLFEKHCYACHGAEKQKNSYRLDLKKEAFTGGDDHAPNLRAGKSAESPLYRFVSGLDAEVQMPPKKKDGSGRLSEGETELLKRWIDEGAIWPEGVDVAKQVDRLDWWSFQPLQKPAVPEVQGSRVQVQNPIDAFITAKLVEKGLPHAQVADARTLIRRLYFDLTGLPPSPEEVASFVKATEDWKTKDKRQSSTDSNFGSPYEALVDQLLASPRYGERWARHWLDVVHYGETHGYDKDKPRNNAWPYRDYVIRAFNEDKPYARFIEEQIAGDALYPGTVDGTVALGFIAAGPWDLIGHAEVPETKTDGMIARHLDRDDMVQNAIGTLCSLTVQCAQCHYHKFDPISQEDYYSLQAVFAAVDRTNVPYYASDDLMKQAQGLDQKIRVSKETLLALEKPWIEKAGMSYSDLTRRIEGASTKAAQKLGNASPDFGYHSAIADQQNTTKWVQVDLGEHTSIDSVKLLPSYDDFNGIGGGFGFPLRFKIETSDDPAFKTGVTLLWRRHDETFMNDFRNPKLQAFTTKSAGDDGIAGRYVRVTAVKLAPRKNDFIFALAEIQVLDIHGKNLALGKEVAALDSIEAPPRWRKANLTDGIAPVSTSEDEKEKLVADRETLLLTQTDTKGRAERIRLKTGLDRLEKEKAKLPPPSQVYAGAIHYGSGSFRGTGPDGGKPRVIRVLKRGDVKTPDKEVGPAAIQALSEKWALPFPATSPAQESTRRAALAHWISDPRNPLTWRSIVNRVWQYHFGQALVETGNDFGRMGAQPTHPALLDWLAATFRDDLNGSLKQLHKLIVMSATYRQSSAIESIPADVVKSAQQSDADNHFLWRQNRRKLDAESLHDAILTVSGKLDLTMGGPSYQDFVVEKPEHSPHYQYHLHNPDDAKCWRRSIYRFIVRSQPQPFMTVMDCADPSMRVDKRNESLSPLQALAMMNNGLTVAMARHLAERAQQEASGLPDQVVRAFCLALSRTPTAEETVGLIAYAQTNGLENTCRVLLNLNEFTFID
ncbi:DUF1553 domain-containing protein [soil metagenome]